MTKILSLLSLLYVYIIFMPALTQAKTACDLNTTFITLTKKDTDIGQIIEEIGEQTDYAIQMNGTDFLKTKKTIYLNNTPLPTCFNRLFKETNYSVICDTAKKTLQIVILENSRKQTRKTVAPPPSTTSPNTNPDAASAAPPPSEELTENNDNWEYPPEPISQNHKVPKIKLDNEGFEGINDML